jgi:hypothetical protein
MAEITERLFDPTASRKDQEQWLRDNIERAEWRLTNESPKLIELMIDENMLAWIQARPSYCDRGHWQAQLEFSPGNPIDFADGMPCYYMNLAVAKQEIKAKLLWRICKIDIDYSSFFQDMS